MPKDEQREEQTKVGERSFVTLGLVGFLVVQTAAGFWWASRITTTLDMLVKREEISTAQGTIQSGSMLTRIEALEKSAEIFTQVGSPALRARLDIVEKKLSDQARDLEVHIESTKGKP